MPCAAAAAPRLARLLLGALAARARVDDQRALALELGAQRLDARREAQPVAEVLIRLVDQKPRAGRAHLHPPAGRHRVARVEEVVVEDGRPRQRAGRRPRRARPAAPSGRPRRRRCGARRRRGRRCSAGRSAPRSTSARCAPGRRRRGGSPSWRKPMNSAYGQHRLDRRVRARALDAADAVLGGDVVRVGHQRRVLGVGDHELDLVALGVVEDDALRLGRVEAQQLAEDVVGDEAVHPELERVVGRDAQDQAMDVAVAGHAARRLLELEEGHDAARVAVLVAEVRVVAEGRLVVERVLDEPQAHDAAPEVDVRLDVGRDAREVVWPTERLHRICSSSSRDQNENLHIPSSACQASILRRHVCEPRHHRSHRAPSPVWSPSGCARRSSPESSRRAPSCARSRSRGASASAPRRCARRWPRCSARASCACTRSAARWSSCRPSRTCASTTRSAPRSRRWPPRCTAERFQERWAAPL